MAARKFADNFVSLNGVASGIGLWADVGDCKQIDYGLEQITGPITDGALVLESAENEFQTVPFVVVEIAASTLADLATKGFQVSEPRPHGRLLRWRITTALVGGTIKATVNGQQG